MSGGGVSLFAGGSFQVADGAPGNHIARWDGTTWSPLDHGTNDSVYTMTVFDDGSGHGPALYVAGEFTGASGIPVGGIARWGNFGVPASITAGPMDTTVNAGHAATLSVQAAGSMPLTYRWRRAGVPISDGGAVSGSRTSTLRFDPVGQDDAGRYDVVVSDPCSSAASTQVILRVLPAVGIEFCRGDGDDLRLTVSCPCSNSGSPGHGCAGSTNADGALLDASGSTLADPTTHTDSVVLSCVAMPSVTTATVMQGNATVSGGAVLGNGIRCAGGQLVRIASVSTANGVAAYPGPGDPSISARGSVTLGSGAVRYYQVVYRDPDPSFCTGSGVDLSNAYRIVW
jgi:hypothetical protein